mmetsp:Transcript_3697/g.6942  ORF Transcript_3697/g.6942 Transcript_3697/m.6942 type:complete len:278 (-) Transcript_3697:204-1037(-)
MSSFDRLPHESVVCIGEWVSAFGLEDFARFRGTCKRMRDLLGQPVVMAQIIQERGAPQNVSTLEELAFFESIKESGLLQENRLGFEMASTEIDFDGSESGLEDAPERIEAVKKIMKRFSKTTVSVDAHCGTAGPRRIASRFSHSRGLEVCSHLHEPYLEGNRQERVILNAWGRQISDLAVLSSHPQSELARTGMGWVDLYVQFGSLEFPSRPDFYEEQVCESVTNYHRDEASSSVRNRASAVNILFGFMMDSDSDSYTEESHSDNDEDEDETMYVGD